MHRLIQPVLLCERGLKSKLKQQPPACDVQGIPITFYKNSSFEKKQHLVRLVIVVAVLEMS